jgi:hypothetical protein
MLTLTISHAIIGGLIIFCLNGLVTLGAAALGVKMALAKMQMQIAALEKKAEQHTHTLYGVNLNNGLRGTVQDHGSRIGVIERMQELHEHGFARDLRHRDETEGMQHG